MDLKSVLLCVLRDETFIFPVAFAYCTETLHNSIKLIVFIYSLLTLIICHDRYELMRKQRL